MADPKLTVRIGANDSEFTATLRGLEAQALRVFGAIGAAATAKVAFTVFTDGLKDVFDLSKGLVNLSDQTGVAVDHLFTLGRSFQDAGLEAEDAGAAINKMQKFLAGGNEGNSKTYDELHKIGLRFLDIKNLNPEEQFREIGKAILGLHSPTEQARASMEIFGKAGAHLLAVFKGSGESANPAIKHQAEVLKENAKSFDESSVKLSHAGDVFRGFYLGVAERASSPLNAFLDRLAQVDLVGIGEEFGDSLIEGATGIVQMLSALKQADLVAMGKAFTGATEAAVKDVGKSVVAAKEVAEEATGFLDEVVAMPHNLHDNVRNALLGPAEEFREEMSKPFSYDVLNLVNGIVARNNTLMPWHAVPEQHVESRPKFEGYSSALDDLTSAGIRMREATKVGAGIEYKDPAGTKVEDMADITERLRPKSPYLQGNDLWRASVIEQQRQEDQARMARVHPASLGVSMLGDSGGLFGPGSDTAEESRQSFGKIRDQVRWDNPLLQGGALNSAVMAQQKREQDQARIDQYRRTYDIQHPEEAKLRQAQAENNRGATEGGQVKIVTAVGELKKAIESLVAQ